MATSGMDSMWNAAFPEKTRPQLYVRDDFDEDGFRPLADPLDFITDISKLTPSQLYAQAANNQMALKEAQDEYLELEKLIHQLKSRDPTAAAPAKNPQTLPTPAEFDERKESVLYGYKYDINRPLASYGRWQDVTEQERRDLRSNQDPFTQGGFVPNDRQYKGLLNRAKDKRNPDNWTPVERDGRRLIPRMALRVNEKEEYWQLSGLLPLAKGMVSKPVTRSGTPDIDAIGMGGRETPVNKRLRNTRFNGAKVPLTRDVSEAPSLPVSRASTPKRKRGDTPSLANDHYGSPVKKPRIVVTEGDLLLTPKRKHHNQYTKAKEKAALEAMAAQGTDGDGKFDFAPQQVEDGLTSIAFEHNHYPWSGLSDQEKREFHWSNDTLLMAVKQDPTWLNEDLKTRQKWTKKITESKYPVRTYSMYKKWDYWRLMGEDKRPRNKKKSKNDDGDEDDHDMDEGSEVASLSPMNRSFNMQDFDDRYHFGRASTTMSPGPSRLGRGEILMHDYRESGDESMHDEEASVSRRSSGSDFASQTISVKREDASGGTVRRTTRASRMASS